MTVLILGARNYQAARAEGHEVCEASESPQLSLSVYFREGLRSFVLLDAVHSFSMGIAILVRRFLCVDKTCEVCFLEVQFMEYLLLHLKGLVCLNSEGGEVVGVLTRHHRH